MKAKVDNSINSTSVVCLDADLVQYLELAYHGMDGRLQRQVEKLEESGISRNQAIFNIIVNHRLVNVYARKGEKKLAGVIPTLLKRKK